MSKYVLAFDQGTTSSRAFIFDDQMEVVSVAQEEFPQYFPKSGWVEHDGEEIWATVTSTINQSLAKAGLTLGDIACVGITNQRETTIIWDKKTGKPIYNAIVWQDRRTSDLCEELRGKGYEAQVSKITGLLLDPYFSGTKIKWILDHVDGAKVRAQNGELAFGTIDSFLIWRMTNGKSHVTDATNAARTMLFDIHKGEWSKEMCDMLDIPMAMLPEVKDCAADFGIFENDGFEIPICGVAGDQQAAAIGQACFEPGMIKSTYGTGCFALLNTGKEAVQSKNRLLTTIAYQLNGERTYALEGSIFVAGAVVQWLRDGLKIIEDASDTQKLAEEADAYQDVIIVPAFTGLGAPYWKPESRGAMFGLTRGTTNKEISRAALQSVGFQTYDLSEAMLADLGENEIHKIRVDGGMSASAYAMQFLSDILNAEVDRPKVLETTVVGAAWLAGHYVGIYADKEEFAKRWARDANFKPNMDEGARKQKIESWKRAVQSTIGFS